MESILKYRFKQESSICSLWKRLPAEQHKRSWIDEQLRLDDEVVLDKLAIPRLSEVLEAMLENRSAVELCGIYTFVAIGQEDIIGEDLAIIYWGIRATTNAVARDEQHELAAAGWKRVDVQGKVSG